MSKYFAKERGKNDIFKYLQNYFYVIQHISARISDPAKGLLSYTQKQFKEKWYKERRYTEKWYKENENYGVLMALEPM